MSSLGDRESISSARTLIEELRCSKRIQEETETYLKEKNVRIGEPVMARRVGDVKQGNVKLTTNAYPTEIQAPLKVYRYDVTIIGIKDRSQREVKFTKKFKDDYNQVDCRLRCRDVIITFMRKHKDLAASAGCMYNDLQSIMYTLYPLPGQGPLDFEFTPNELYKAEEFGRFKLGVVKLRFTPASEVTGISFSGVREQSNLLYVNRDLAQFLDIATSQDAFFRENEHVHFSTGSSYLFQPENYGFNENDVCAFEENDTYLAIGCQKAIHVVQGAQGMGHSADSTSPNGIPAVVVQPKKTPFHANNELLVKVQALLSSKQNASIQQQAFHLEKNLKGIMVETTHNPRNKQIFPIKTFDPSTAAQKQVQTSDGTMTVAEYFQRKYHVSINQTRLPLVVTDMKGPEGKTQQNYYPVEVLVVCDNQRVKTAQLTSNMTSILIKKCAIPPAILQAQIEKVAKSMHFWDSTYLEKARVRIPAQPLQVFARMQPLPQLQSGDGPTRPRDDGTWRVGKMLQPQQMVGQGQQYPWAVLVFSLKTDRFKPNQQDVSKFLQMYTQQARARGVVLGEPRSDRMMAQLDRYEDMGQYFEWANEQQFAFLLCFHPDADDDMHHEIKANERRYLVITQCVRFQTVRNVVTKNQRLTIDNIVNKTNVKLGGLNYTMSQSVASDMKTLVIGFSSNHPGGGFGAGSDDASTGDNPNRPPSFVAGPPTVVGFAANVGPTKLSFDFVGDFMFQVARREEKVNIIETVVQRCVHFFKSTRGGQLPERVIIYRNGCSEGQFSSLLKYEVPLLKKALQDQGCDPKLIMIVCNKLQNLRFFQDRIDPRAKATEQNLKPGTVIDTTAVHPVFAEFFLNSHRALQGTARTPKYTVVYDNSGESLADLESLTYDFCYGHQIVFSPLSLPAPVYIANEYAKRGRNLYNKLFEELKRQNPGIGYTELNNKLSFYGETGAECWIAEYRVNA